MERERGGGREERERERERGGEGEGGKKERPEGRRDKCSYLQNQTMQMQSDILTQRHYFYHTNSER